MLRPSRWRIFIVLIIGILGVSLAAIWIRLAVSAATVENKIGNKIGFSLFLAASRLIVAALILLPTWKKTKSPPANSQAYYYAIAAGVCLAIHFAAWTTSLSYTSIAASTVLVTTNPLWVGLLSWWWLKEKLSRYHFFGIGIALIGAIVIAIADIPRSFTYNITNISTGSGSENLLRGDLLALFGALMSSLYIIFGSQAQRKGLDTSKYIAIAYSTAALCLFPLPFLYQTSYFGYGLAVYFYVFLMALMSQVFGHTSLNWSVRWISPTLVSLSLLFEPLIASLFGVFIFKEIPSFNLFLGGLIILVGIGIFLKSASTPK